MSRAQRDDGAAVVEFALVMPLLLLLIFGIIDFGRIFWEQGTLSGAAREGVRRVALAETEGPVVANAVDEATGVSGLTVTVTQADGTTTAVEDEGVVTAGVTLPACTVTQAVTVTVSAPFSFWTPLPGIATFTGVDTLTGTGVMRCGG